MQVSKALSTISSPAAGEVMLRRRQGFLSAGISRNTETGELERDVVSENSFVRQSI